MYEDQYINQPTEKSSVAKKKTYVKRFKSSMHGSGAKSVTKTKIKKSKSPEEGQDTTRIHDEKKKTKSKGNKKFDNPYLQILVEDEAGAIIKKLKKKPFLTGKARKETPA